MKISLPCIACGRELKQVFDEAATNQPYAGTAFRTHGHYGSTAYDPMDGHYLEINICDLCLVTHRDRVVEGRDRKPVMEDGSVVGWEDCNWKELPWAPKKREIDWVFEQARKEFEIDDPMEADVDDPTDS